MAEKPTISELEKALDSIRPFLAADGGDVRVLEIDYQNMVYIELLGNCEGCPMSTMTMKAGIEEAIKNEFPQIESVIAANVQTNTERVDSAV